MTTPTPIAPPYDPELATVLAQQTPSTVTPEMITLMQAIPPTFPDVDALAARNLRHTERTVPGPTGAPDVVLSLFEKTDRVAGGPAIYTTHGGGMITGNRFTGIETLLDWVDEFDLIVVSVEYRLAPQHPYPAPIDDCYAGLLWTAAHAGELNFDPERLLVAGASAGGGLAAGLALMSRDNGAPTVAGQILIYPMLDDRNDTVSSHQMDGIGIWDHGSNETGWNAYLGDRHRNDDVPIYAAPARATDLSNLPPAVIDVGSAEVFRDEDVAYASKIWADGGIAELHVWPGAFHGFDGTAPTAAVSRAAIHARSDAVRRLLDLSKRS
jgi:acetyl esterase/lipase